MNTSIETPIPRNVSVLRQIRPIALLVGLLFALPAAAFPAHAMWFIGTGLFCGLLVALYLEFRTEEKEEVRELLATLPPDFEGLGSFKDVVYLELPQSAQSGQLEFSEPTISTLLRKKQKKAATIVHLEGRNHYLIDCDRFVALLLDRMAEDANRAAEHALTMGIKRYGGVSPLERILSDNTVVEVIKSDFRGNMLMVINRTGEKVIRELIKQAKKAEEPKSETKASVQK